MPAGRPTDYTPEIAAEICFRLTQGQSLRSIAKADDMPPRSVIHRWLLLHPEFADQYTRAKEVQADEMFDEILDIADSKQGDVTTDEFGNEKPNNEYIQRSRLRVDTRKWYLSKVLPKKYGERIETHLTGGTTNRNLNTTIDPKDMDNAELNQTIKDMLG